MPGATPQEMHFADSNEQIGSREHARHKMIPDFALGLSCHNAPYEKFKMPIFPKFWSFGHSIFIQDL